MADTLDLLTPPLYTLATASATPGEKPNRLIYFRSSDAKKALDSLKKLVTGGSQGMVSLDESEYLGYRISTLETGIVDEEENEGAPAGVPEIAFAATDTHLFVSPSGKCAIEDALRGIGKEVRPLNASDDRKRATASLPALRWGVSFARLGRQRETHLETMTNVAAMTDNPGLDAFASLHPGVLATYADLCVSERHSDGAGIAGGFRFLPPAATTTPSRTER